MRMSPIAPALWLAGIATLILTLLFYALGIPFLDPLISIIFYLLSLELSKFVAEMTFKDDDG